MLSRAKVHIDFHKISKHYLYNKLSFPTNLKMSVIRYRKSICLYFFWPLSQHSSLLFHWFIYPFI